MRLFACLVLAGCVSTPIARGPAAPETDTLTYLGVAGWKLAHGDHVLLVDPYFSRVHVDDDAVVIAPDGAAIRSHAFPSADAILVGHSHYDHVLDAPSIAKGTHAPIVGTESTLNVARAAGVPSSQLVRANGGETLAFGAFSVRVVRGLHSLTGQTSAEIPAQIQLPLRAKDYAEGGTLQWLVTAGGKRVFFIGSANFIESEIDGLRPDVAVVAVGLREKIPDYACRLMRALGAPRLVLANHFDAHWEPLGPKQMDIGDEGRASLAHFADEIHACAPATKVVVPAHLEPIAI